MSKLAITGADGGMGTEITPCGSTGHYHVIMLCLLFLKERRKNQLILETGNKDRSQTG